MSQSLVEWLIVGLSVAALVQQAPRLLAYLSDRQTRSTCVGLLALCLGAFVGDSELFGLPSSFRLLYTAVFLGGVLAPLLGSTTRGRDAISRGSAAWALALTLWLAGVNMFQNEGLSTRELFVRMLPAVVWLAILLVGRVSPMDRRMIATVATFAFAVCGTLLPLVDAPWRACDETKCGAFDGMLTGIYSSENYVGLLVAFIAALNVASFGFRGSLRLAPLVVLWLLATESRNSQVALACALAVALLARIVLRQRGDGFLGSRSLAPRLLATGLPLAVMGVAAWILTNSTTESFSGRGRVWTSVAEAMSGHNWSGLGVDAWERLQAVGLLPDNLYAHSLYVFVWFAGGFVGLVLLFAMMRNVLLAGLRRDRDPVPTLTLVITFMTLGLLELAWNPMSIDGMTWIPLALVASRGRGGHTSEPPVAVPQPSTRTQRRRSSRAL